MSATECYVYAVCHGSPTRYPRTDGLYLQTMFAGSRSQCKAYIVNRARNNLPTHFLHTSSLSTDRATSKFL